MESHIEFLHIVIDERHLIITHQPVYDGKERLVAWEDTVLIEAVDREKDKRGHSVDERKKVRLTIS